LDDCLSSGRVEEALHLFRGDFDAQKFAVVPYPELAKPELLKKALAGGYPFQSFDINLYSVRESGGKAGDSGLIP
jgi:hypothetical protein